MELPGAAPGEDPDLPGVGILSHIWISVRRDDQDADDVISLVPDLMTTAWPTGQGDDLAFAKLSVTVVQTNDWCAAQDNK